MVRSPVISEIEESSTVRYDQFPVVIVSFNMQSNSNSKVSFPRFLLFQHFSALCIGVPPLSVARSLSGTLCCLFPLSDQWFSAFPLRGLSAYLLASS